MNIRPPYSSSPCQVYEMEHPYFDSNQDQLQVKEKGEQIHPKNWSSNDAILDEEFETAERYAKVSPDVKKGEPDDIEIVTAHIFAHLYELVNRTKRKEGEDWDAILSGHSPSPRKNHFSKSFRLLHGESHFLDDSYLDYPLQAENGIQDLLNAVTEIFFGVRFDGRDQKTSAEMEHVLKKDQVAWNTWTSHDDDCDDDKKIRLRSYYKPYFQAKMDQFFQNAQELLKERMDDAKSSFYCRIAFYAGLIISAVGILTSRKFVSISGVAVSLIMSGYMIVRYAISTLRQMQQESNLKRSIDSIYNHNEAAKHRINLNTSDP